MRRPDTPAPTPAGVVADAGARIAALASRLWSAATPDELIGTVEEIQSLTARLAALQAVVVAEIDARDLARTSLGWASTADWLTHLAGLRRGQGRRLVDHARQLTGDRAATLAALREGAVSPEQASVVLDAVERLPGSPGVRDRGEAALLDDACRLNASDLAKVARYLVEVADPDCTGRDLERQLEREDRAAHLGRFLAISEDGAGGVRLRGRGTAEDAATLKAALLPLTAPVPTIDPVTCAEVRDPRDHGARLWDALVTTAQQSLAGGLLPESHGARPRVGVTISLEALRGDAGVDPGSIRGVTEDGLELPPGVVRRLACDANIIPIALGSRSEILDVGRAFRLVTLPLWRALVCRDKQCTFPGCTRPPIMCHAHHITHWAAGGTTALDNLVLLCGYHHRTIHNDPWQVRISLDDGRPEFRAPANAGRPPPGWVRHRPRRQ